MEYCIIGYVIGGIASGLLAYVVFGPGYQDRIIWAFFFAIAWPLIALYIFWNWLNNV